MEKELCNLAIVIDSGVVLERLRLELVRWMNEHCQRTGTSFEAMLADAINKGLSRLRSEERFAAKTR